MKKIYILASMIASLGFCGSSIAQSTTITATALPQIGFVYNMASDTAMADMPTFTVSAGSASSQTWNYTTQFANIYGESTSFVNKSIGLGNAGFPNATMAVAIDTNWAYLLTNANGVYVDGAYVAVAAGSYATVDYTPNQLLMPVPFTYPNSVNNLYTATFTFTSGSQTVTVKHRANRTVSADAFGSITTPAATYPNTLRRKTYEITSDSAFVFGSVFAFAQYDTTTNYTWVQNSQDAEVMSIDMDRTGAVTKTQYLQSFSNGVQVINKPSYGFNLFPNPASDMTYLTYENKNAGAVTLQLMDLTGKQIALLVDTNQPAGKQKMAINLTALHLPAGLYFLQLISNNALQTIKLSVN